MKSLRSNLFVAAALAAGLLGASNGAMAASTWVYQFAGVDGGAATTSYTGAPTTAPDLTISGRYVANGASNTGVSGNWNNNAASALTYYSGGGLGMLSDGSAQPNHAIDNGGTNTEAVLLSFASVVKLTSIGLGYKSGDADVSVFRYTGTVAPTLTGGATLSAMTTAGWELVGNYADLSTDTSDPYNTINPQNKGSSWWLISAYNSAWGTGTGLSQGDDYFKMFAVAGDVCTNQNTSTGVCGGGKAPEPGSLALLGAAAVAAVGVRRRGLKVAKTQA
jgi:hypothetical protein